MSEDQEMYLTEYKFHETIQGNKGERMRKPVKQIYDRQVARCLADIEELYDLPEMVEERVKRAIEYTAKDVDKINHKESGHGYNNAQRHS